MNAVKQDVEKLVQKELESANRRFPMFHSDYEGAAVIFEKIEMSKYDFEHVERYFNFLWSKVKTSGRYGNCIKNIIFNAYNLAYEAIQIAALAQKFIDSQKEGEKRVRINL